MEANALHNFTATSEDELSFEKGSIVKVFMGGGLEEMRGIQAHNNLGGVLVVGEGVGKLGGTAEILIKGPHWHRAEQEGREGLVPNNYVKMLPAPWFSPDVTKDEAERLLHLYPEGGFIMRESQGTPGDFVLSVRFKNGVQHFKVLRDAAGKYFLWVVKFNSLNLLVNHHQKSSISRTEKVFLCLPDMCTAVFDFDGKEANELSFKAGDCIMVLEKSHADWWKGSCNGKVGDFPRTYVKSTEY